MDDTATGWLPFPNIVFVMQCVIWHVLQMSLSCVLLLPCAYDITTQALYHAAALHVWQHMSRKSQQSEAWWCGIMLQ